MALFKNRKTAAAPESTPAESSAVKQKAKKKSEMLSSTVKETVTETVMEQAFKKNTDFIVMQDGETKYVGFFFDTNRIGGLSQRAAKKNKDAGSIIEAVNSGSIAALVTDELLNLDAMVIVPNKPTLETMEEYTCLDIEYPLAYVSENGDVDIKETTMKIAQAQSILDGKASLSSVIGAEEQPEEEGEEPVEETAEAPDAGMEEDYETVDDEALAFESSEEEPVYDESMEDADAGSWSGDEEGVWDEEPEEPEEEEIEEIPKEMYEQAITRRLFSDDLDLEVTTEPFDSQFLHQNEFIPFVEDRGAGWLDTQLANLAREANAELKKLHQDNLLAMRSEYFNLISKFCSDLSLTLDYQNPNTAYGSRYQLIESDYARSLDEIGNKTAEERARLDREWETNVENAGRAAMEAEMQRYRDRNGRAHQDAIREVELRVKNEIESTKADRIRSMMDDRREEARKRLEIGVNTALSAVSEKYLDLLKDEKAQRDKHQQALQDFLDNNRKQEIARVETLAEELSQSEKADAVLAEYTAKIQNLTAEFDARKTALSDELEQMKRQHAQALADKDKEAKARENRDAERINSLQHRIDELMDQMAQLDEKKTKEVQQRIDDLVGEREAMSQKYEHLSDMVKANRHQMVAMATIGVIAAIVVGFVAGQFVNLSGKSTDAQAQIAEDFQDMLDNMKFDLPEGWSAEVSEDGTVTITQDAEAESVSE